jgi:quercetin dioxygenase-like cupin family protein
MELFSASGWVQGETAATTQPEPGLVRKIGARNARLMVAEHRMVKGWVGMAHSHPHDQAAYVVYGHIHVRTGDREFELRAGDSFVVTGGVEHQAKAIEDSLVVDVFTPCREDYL